MGTQVLTHSPAEIMQRLLVSLSLGTLPSSAGSWPIYILTEPETPDQCITVYETAGIVQSREAITGVKFERYGIQFRIRDLDPTTGRAKASAISDAMDKSVRYNSITIDSTTYRIHSYSRISTVLDIGKERPQSQRRIFTLNGTIAVTNIT